MDDAILAPPGNADVMPPADYRSAIDRRIPPPAVMDEGWLPDETGWPELNELREQHVRLRRASAAAARARTAIEERHKAEDDAKHAALKESVATGKKAKLPKVTPPEERAAELREASERSKAALEAFLDNVDRIVEVVAEHQTAWVDDLDAADRDLAAAIREAELTLTGLRSRQGSSVRLRHWIERTGEGMPVMYISYAAIPAPAPPDGPAREEWIADRMRLSLRPPGFALVPIPNPDPDGDSDFIYVNPDDPRAKALAEEEQANA